MCAVSSCAGIFERTDIGVKNDRSSSVTLFLVYSNGHTVDVSLSQGKKLLLGGYDNKVLKSVVVTVNGKTVLRCSVPERRPKNAWLHIRESGCSISELD